MIKYAVEPLENELVLRRANTWFGSLAASLPMLAGCAWAIHFVFRQPVDSIMVVASLLFFCMMLTVLYRLFIWGRYISFDKKSNLLTIDGRRVCALSDLLSVGMEGSQRSPLFPKLGRLQSLRLRTVQGKNIELNWGWEGNPDYAELTATLQAITSFVDLSG